MRIVFMGTPEFAVPILQSLLESTHNICLVVTQPDKCKGRGKVCSPPPVKKTAVKHHLSVVQPGKLSDQGFYQDLKKISPDLIVTAAYGKMVPSDILLLPDHGAINVHASLLPKFRGAAPIHRAVMNGERETGVTIMRMTEQMDAGDILSAERIPISCEDTTGIIYDKIVEKAPGLLLDTIAQLEQGDIKPIKQDENRATYAPKLTKEDEKLDFKLEDAKQVYNHIRGLNPWPGAHVFFGDKRIKAWKSQVFSLEGQKGSPGEILDITENGPIVQCKQGAVILTELQMSGKRICTGRDFLCGYSVHPGDLFT